MHKCLLPQIQFFFHVLLLMASFSTEWFNLSEKEQKLHAAQLCDMQRALPFWVALRVMRGVSFDDLYGTLQPSSCVWACESEEANAVCFKLHDDDDWFRFEICVVFHHLWFFLTAAFLIENTIHAIIFSIEHDVCCGVVSC
jgi:hypothetical protein